MPWDNWLARMLAASQAEVGESWLHTYLTSPPWRFALDPDLLGDTGWIGVLVSSVDSLHRCFPLTLAASGTDIFAETTPWLGYEDWTERAEALALAMIDAGGSLDAGLVQFRDMAEEVADPRRGRFAAPGAADTFMSAYELVAPVEAGGRGGPQTAAFSYWWHGDWPGHPAIALRCRGLPDAAICAGFFDALWFERGVIQTPLSGSQ